MKILSYILFASATLSALAASILGSSENLMDYATFTMLVAIYASHEGDE